MKNSSSSLIFNPSTNKRNDFSLSFFLLEKINDEIFIIIRNAFLFFFLIDYVVVVVKREFFLLFEFSTILTRILYCFFTLFSLSLSRKFLLLFLFTTKTTKKENCWSVYLENIFFFLLIVLYYIWNIYIYILEINRQHTKKL